jgi:transposase
MKKHIIEASEYAAIKKASKENRDKRVDKRLQVLQLRYEGATDAEIGSKLRYHRKRVSQLCAEYKKDGLEKYVERRYGGNSRNMTEEEEKVFLAQFENAAKNAEVLLRQLNIECSQAA